MEVCEGSSRVCGYHIYKDVWHALTGEELQCERDPDTNIQTEAIGMQSLLRDGIITGHLPIPHKYHNPVPFC